ncbi:hypothetical protein BO86DRAFT_153583 [Aspergillus japonicus CBS 114.51]|uniref:Secreted protein n=1 Tax=Aspergillus japonicus CBS 114.51 TaxID=1448312 RepID=A0A8T8WVM9_ASPJA|nr:hypothetical protein BO86DRAFT_153583 [Aspergillus japonicus CBS 114.51]RAH79379.1 hypothetical protein BO86DRAFT_153583 [Aspergillus japonicus CBS 114.51]
MFLSSSFSLSLLPLLTPLQSLLIALFPHHTPLWATGRIASNQPPFAPSPPPPPSKGLFWSPCTILLHVPSDARFHSLSFHAVCARQPSFNPSLTSLTSSLGQPANPLPARAYLHVVAATAALSVNIGCTVSSGLVSVSFTIHHASTVPLYVALASTTVITA